MSGDETSLNKHESGFDPEVFQNYIALPIDGAKLKPDELAFIFGSDDITLKDVLTRGAKSINQINIRKSK